MVIYNPTDGRQPLVGVLAPGMVGTVTAMNNAGVIMGVDTLRSAQATPRTPGLNALLLVRSTVHNSANSEDAIKYIGNARRGCPYLVCAQRTGHVPRPRELGGGTDVGRLPCCPCRAALLAACCR